MFSYYGSKSKIAHLYPAPQYDRIIEPFAGSGTTVEAAVSAGFRVVAVEKDPAYVPLVVSRLDRTQ